VRRGVPRACGALNPPTESPCFLPSARTLVCEAARGTGRGRGEAERAGRGRETPLRRYMEREKASVMGARPPEDLAARFSG